MITRIAITGLLTLAFHAPVQATKFQLGDKAEADKTVGNATDRSIEGVLLREEDGIYTIRVAGGEIQLAKSQVLSMTEDGLTVAQIETSEKQGADQVAEAETRRREIQATEASSRRAEPVPPRADDAGERTLRVEVDFQSLLPGYTFRAYDPVLHRANIYGLKQVIEDYLRDEVRAAAHRSK